MRKYPEAYCILKKKKNNYRPSSPVGQGQIVPPVQYTTLKYQLLCSQSQ